jgi:hypothetical protein
MTGVNRDLDGRVLGPLSGQPGLAPLWPDVKCLLYWQWSIP